MIPVPPVQLVNVCSTIFNNTLYTYNQDAFQSLSISQGAEWLMLPMGVPVTGGVCVQATPPDNSTVPALYIVGGVANASATANASTAYGGLQRYVFGTGKWESIMPLTPVTQNRLYHNAVYLNTSSSILVYAGTQDGSSSASSQTFTINTTPPYDVLSYPSQGAPPGVSPLLMQWSESKAVMMGGGSSNDQVYTFDPSRSWVNLNTTLDNPLRESSAVRAVVVNGNDGSKNLYTFDMTTSPNTVNRTILVDGDGNPVPLASAVIERSLDGDQDNDLEKRGNLTETNWPTYNDTFVSMAERRNFSISKDQSGQVIIAGGSTTDVLCMFRARKNVWVNATAVFYSDKAISSQGLGDATTSGTTAATATSEADAKNALDDPASRAMTMKILGAVLGSIAGIAVILFSILLFLRWRRNRRAHTEAGHQRRSSGLEKETLDFGEKAPTTTFGHAQQDSAGSFSSMAILMGRVHPHLTRKRTSGNSSNSDGFNKKYAKTISSPVPNAVRSTVLFGENEKQLPPFIAAPTPPPTNALPPTPRPITRLRNPFVSRANSARRSSGWNKYWSGGSLGILGFGNKRNSEARSESSESDYSSSGVGLQRGESLAARVTPPPPLALPNRPPAMNMNRVQSGSPTVTSITALYPFNEPMSGRIETAQGHAYTNSTSSIDTYNTRDLISANPSPESDQGRWDYGARQPAQGYYNSALYSESEIGANASSGVGYGVASVNNPFLDPPASAFARGQAGGGMTPMGMAFSPSYHTETEGVAMGMGMGKARDDLSWINLNTGVGARI